MLIIADEPGRNGTIDITIKALAGRANITEQEMSDAIKILSSPDIQSRTKDMEGRRISQIDDHRNWGWKILNWEKHSKERISDLALLRKRKERHDNTLDPMSPNVTQCHEEVEVEVEVEGEVNHKEKPFVGNDEKPIVPRPYGDVVEEWFGNANNTERLVPAWKEAYPAIDIGTEVLKAKAWLLANRGKSKKDFAKFLNNWMARARSTVFASKKTAAYGMPEN